MQAFFSDITVLHSKVMIVSEEKQISKYYKIAVVRLKKTKTIVINYHTAVYNHAICVWLEDNMDSKVISKNFICAEFWVTEIMLQNPV